jgi:hypothetical protein
MAAAISREEIDQCVPCRDMSEAAIDVNIDGHHQRYCNCIIFKRHVIWH